MNKKPVSYMQTDAKWSALPYRVTGESATIGGSGCGPTCAAMCIATLKDKSVTPVTTCKWSVQHGYKALNQGTYYSYFVPQFAAYGIQCRQLLASRILNQPQHKIHDQVKTYLAQGYYAIALMGPGTWTRGGHFILLYGWDDKVRINDPASYKAERMNGNPDAFRKEVRLYWLVDAREYNNEGKNSGDKTSDGKMMEKEENMDLSKLTDQQVLELGDRLDRLRGELPPSGWSIEAREWAEQKGIINGDESGKMKYRKGTTREELVQILYNQEKVKCGFRTTQIQ